MSSGQKTHKNQPHGQESERPLPQNVDAEKLILGSILLDGNSYQNAAAALDPEDFCLEKHRRIFRRMGQLSDRAEKIDRVTVAEELSKHNELESVDGLSYLVSLDDGLPQIPNIDAYIRIVKDKSRLRLIIHASTNTLSRAYLAEQSPQEIVATATDALLAIGGSNEAEVDITPFGIIQSYPGGIDEFMDPSKTEVGLGTGFTQFDEMTAGLQPEDLIVIGGRPSSGKTSWALTVAEHVTIKLKKRVAVFSLEMSKVQNLRRMICSLARVDYKKFRMGYLNAHENEKLAHARNWLVDSKLLIDANPILTVTGFRAKMNKIVKKYGVVDLAIVDYLQLMSTSGKTENRNQEVSAQARGLKLAAKEFNIPIMALSQLSRAVDTRKGDHRPQLSDLRESGGIEQDADMVGFIFREELYKKDCDELKGRAELIIGKQRSGECGTVKLTFLGNLMRFENFSADTYDEHGD